MAPVPAPPVDGDVCGRCQQPLELSSTHTVLPEHNAAEAGHYHADCCPYAFCDGRLHHPNQQEMDNSANGLPAGTLPEDA